MPKRKIVYFFPSSSPNPKPAESHERKKRRVALAIVAIFLVWVIGGISYHFLENWNFIDSFYFAAVTITTIGYGDHFPTTQLSKLFTIAYVFVGIAIVFYSLTLVGGYYLDQEFTRAMARVNRRGGRGE